MLNTVFIDPGHGGKDTGCPLGIHEVESNWVWERATEAVSNLMTNREEVILVLSRDSDQDPTAKERAEKAFDCGSSAVICLHVNSTTNTREHGSLVFRQLSGSPMSTAIGCLILTTLNRPGEYINNEGHLQRMQSQIHQPKDDPMHWTKRVWNVMHHYGPIPSVLVEFEYASHPDSLSWLLSDTGKTTCVRAITNAIKYAAEY